MNFDITKSVAYDMQAKAAFHRVAARQLRVIAKQLGLTKDQYDLRHNQGGIAVSGEITLHTDHVYVQVSQSGSDGVLYRTCKGRKDYTGGPNHFGSLTMLMTSPATLAAKIADLMERASCK